MVTPFHGLEGCNLLTTTIAKGTLYPGGVQGVCSPGAGSYAYSCPLLLISSLVNRHKYVFGESLMHRLSWEGLRSNQMNGPHREHRAALFSDSVSRLGVCN